MTNLNRIVVNLINGTQEIVPLTEEEIFELQTRPQPDPVVPFSITPRQARLLLLQQNLLADVETLIAQQDEATKITWQYALEFRRDDPLLNQLAQNLNLTQEQLDQFFIEASAL